jgi:sugar fermentation stimulation protein A
MCKPSRSLTFLGLGAPLSRSMAPQLRRSARFTRSASTTATISLPPSGPAPRAPSSSPNALKSKSDSASPLSKAATSLQTASSETVYSLPSRLQRGVLELRYKRFLSDVLLPGDAGLVHAHCPNPGSMRGFGLDKQPPCLVSEAPDGSKRRLPYTLEAIFVDDATWVGCNTQIPNTVVGAWLDARGADALSLLGEYENVRSEVAYGSDGKSRVDFLLEYGQGTRPLYLEVKNVTMAWDDGTTRVAVFPDSKTVRGQKHLRELGLLAKSGKARACVLYFVNRNDCTSFAPCTIDAKYVSLFEESIEAGVQAIPVAFQLEFDETTGDASFAFDRELPLHRIPGP